MNLPIAKFSDVQRESDVFDKTKWTNIELLALSSRFRDAATKLDAARVSGSLDGMRQAYTELQTIRDQTSHLLEGLQHAIEAQERNR